MIKLRYFAVLIFVFTSCASDRIYVRSNNPVDNQETQSKVLHNIYLIGDAGDDTSKSKPTLDLLKKELELHNDKSSAVLFLGDNIYPEGLHSEGHALRAQDERRIDIQLNTVSDFKGEIVFIPGNHDWHKGKVDGFEYIKRQEDYIQSKHGGKIFEPSDGCSGPDDVELSDALTLILIDTQWLLHKYEKGIGEKDDCKHSTKEGFFEAFKELLKKNKDKNVIVAGHHPLYSNGVHGGNFTIKDHLFPLTNLNEKLWIPIPVLGSVYPFYRSYFGNLQDLTNPSYREMKNELLKALNEYENIVYVAGHEHNLQYTEVDQLHHIVSGSGSKVTNLHYNKKLDFGAEQNGFSKIEILENGNVYLSFYSSNTIENPIFRKNLFTKEISVLTPEEGISKKSYAGLYKTVVPDSSFAANKLKRRFFGDLNRDLWTLPIEVPYLDIHHIYGGLVPIEKGGGMQTLSLKMKGGDGKEYKLRAIKKTALYLVSRDLRGTIAQEIVYDGIGGSHPYASVTVSEMAKEVDVYYTQPRLVYVPKDSILGGYLDEFGGAFCLLEIHPDEDMSEYKNFGQSARVLNYKKAIKKLENDQKNQVDISFAVRSRLLDILLGDWDRHDDQWRWASFEEKNKTIFRPIPRDRDQVFFKFDGIVMKIANRKWLMRKFQPFENEIRDIAGLNYNARYFDRYFLVEANDSIWEVEALKIQNQLSDSVIEEAIKKLPEPAFNYNGESLIDILKERRNRLLEFAQRYYSILAENVNVYGSLNKDCFEVNRLSNGDVEVSIYPRVKGKKLESERSFYRKFKYNETKEIRLYGLDDKDEYKINGLAKKSITVRVIAGDDQDKIEDNSLVKGWKHHTKVYEIVGEQNIEQSAETKVEIRKKSDAYYFDRKEFEYNKLIPIPSIGYNVNDGMYLGPGFQYTKEGFKKNPYAVRHEMKINYAFRAEGINFNYRNDYIDLIGDFDFGLDLTLNRPQVFQFYGQGNETTESDSRYSDRLVQLNNTILGTRISYSSDDLSSRLSAVASYQIVDLKDYSEIPLDTIPRKNQDFVDFGISYTYKNRDATVNPSRGIEFITNLSHIKSIVNSDVEMFRLSASLSLYFPISYFRKQTTFAIRTGFSTNIGDYNFYQANYLSGTSEFRGVGRNRYAGKIISYSNAELRRSFIKVKNYIPALDFGFIAHFDLAKVWVESDQSKLWHYSFGGGLYLDILDYIALVGTYSISDTDQLFNLGTKFYF